jgi:hypothetical protein
MPCQWYVREGGEGKRRILIGQSASIRMAFGRLKLSSLVHAALHCTMCTEIGFTDLTDRSVAEFFRRGL